MNQEDLDRLAAERANVFTWRTCGGALLMAAIGAAAWWLTIYVVSLALGLPFWKGAA